MLAPPTNRASPNQNQASLVLEATWRLHWPFISASIIAFFMLIFGLAVAALEPAGLDQGSDIDTTSVKIPSSSSSANRANSYKIGVGIWSGAIVVVAAISIFVINCATSVQHWAHIAIGLVGAAAVFSVTNFSINAKIVRQEVISDGFSSNGSSTENRLAAAQIPAASLSFLACIAFMIMYVIVAAIQIPRAVKRQLGGFQSRKA